MAIAAMKRISSAACPRALTRALRLFDVLSRNADGLTLTDLYAMLEAPRSSLFNLLQPLVRDGYLLRSEHAYQLGPATFLLAANIMSVWSLRKHLRPFLEELASRSGESVYVGVLDPQQAVITCIDAIESSKSLRYSIPIGTKQPLYCTAAGRVVLAHAEPQWQEHFIRTAKPTADTGFTTIDRSELREQLQEIRRTGIASTISELLAGSAAISSPVYGMDGQVIAVFTIGSPADRFAGERERLQEMILDVAKRASGLRA
jgi:IclR family transcriptional regulator, acetate operon repressor